MATAKIENYEGTADTFNFPYNPQSVDDPTVSNWTMNELDYRSTHIAVSGGGISPKEVVFQGHFSDTTKEADYRKLNRHFNYENTKLKKLYFNSDKFWLGLGRQAKQSYAGTAPGKIDYVARFTAIVGVLFDDTQSTSGTNGGDVNTYVEQITGTVASGASDVTITDNFGNQLTIPASALSTSDSFQFDFVKMVDSGDSNIFVTEYNYVTINGTQTNEVRVTGGNGVIKLAPGEDISADITTTNLNSVTKKYRDAWSGQ